MLNMEEVINNAKINANDNILFLNRHKENCIKEFAISGFVKSKYNSRKSLSIY